MLLKPSLYCIMNSEFVIRIYVMLVCPKCSYFMLANYHTHHFQSYLKDRASSFLMEKWTIMNKVINNALWRLVYCNDALDEQTPDY